MPVVKIDSDSYLLQVKSKNKGKYTYEKTAIKGIYIKKRIGKKTPTNRNIVYKMSFSLAYAVEIDAVAKKAGTNGARWIKKKIIDIIDKLNSPFWDKEPM